VKRDYEATRDAVRLCKLVEKVDDGSLRDQVVAGAAFTASILN
jgi:hypothetical protein